MNHPSHHHHLVEKLASPRMELPPGFRFHPTDEELVTHYLLKKAADGSFTACAIGEVDLNKCEPWDLPWRAKMGEKEWYFFCVKGRKNPTGLRTNRATESGYWKATGKDKEIHSVGKTTVIIGMKKTLVFYLGRAPKGEKTDWIMHEYRLEQGHPSPNHSLHRPPKKEWVLCRVFKKNIYPMAKVRTGPEPANVADVDAGGPAGSGVTYFSTMAQGCYPSTVPFFSVADTRMNHPQVCNMGGCGGWESGDAVGSQLEGGGGVTVDMNCEAQGGAPILFEGCALGH